MSNKARGAITYPFSNFNGCTVDVWDRTSNPICSTHRCWLGFLITRNLYFSRSMCISKLVAKLIDISLNRNCDIQTTCIHQLCIILRHGFPISYINNNFRLTFRAGKWNLRERIEPIPCLLMSDSQRHKANSLIFLQHGFDLEYVKQQHKPLTYQGMLQNLDTNLSPCISLRPESKYDEHHINHACQHSQLYYVVTCLHSYIICARP